MIIVSTWVDDLWYYYHKDDENEYKEIEERVRAKFDGMKKAEELHAVLGMRVQRDRARRTLTIDQQVYTEDVLRALNMEFCKEARTPAVEKNLSKNDGPSDEGGQEAMRAVPYQEAVGSLLWLAGQTRPDIAFPVAVLTRFMANPGQAHWEGAKRVLRYLQGTRTAKLCYGAHTQGKDEAKASVCVLEAYSDADWAADIDSRRSMTGYVVFVNGNLVAWSSKKQPTVAVSTAEAEYMGMSAVTEELMWMRQFLTEIGLAYERPIVLRTDNQAARIIATGDVSSSRTKHIDIRHHQVREQIESGEIDVRWVPTEQQIADILTKCLPADRFIALRQHLVRV
jgi:hypothetical protein